jgi:UDPglucose 6-dehydrogenase/GDP-mannose 6-dehydrogenase
VKISIIGTGYVGLVTGACLAAGGHTVICVDIRREVVEQINRGQSPIFEAGLDELLAKVVENKMLRASSNTRTAIRETDVTIICVGTPNFASDVDMSQIVAAADSIGSALAEKRAYHVVAVKSTVLPGTTEDIVRTAIETQSGHTLGNDWGLCMNPEFLREGRAVADCLLPDRIVIGATDSRAAEVLLNVYSHVNCPKIVTSLRTAEMIKYVANSFLATMISFSNEMANLCSRVSGIDACHVWSGVHLDRRLASVGADAARPVELTEYLWHGLGFGGSCFPKDVAALQGLGKRLGEATPLLDAVLLINAMQPMRLISLLEKEIDLANRRVAVLGLAFKPGTDDLRESPAIAVVSALCQRGAHVVAHDPVAMPRAQKRTEFKSVTFVADWQSALRDTDACCIVTAWPVYRTIQPWDFKRLMRYPLVVDGRGLFKPDLLAAAGVIWRGIGYTPPSSKG